MWQGSGPLVVPYADSSARFFPCIYVVSSAFLKCYPSSVSKQALLKSSFLIISMDTRTILLLVFATNKN